MRCDQCEALMINGGFCHETGCPNTRKAYNTFEERWITVYRCLECGGIVEEGESCCQLDDTFDLDTDEYE